MLTKEEVKNIADLAKIGLSEKEIEANQKDLSNILDYFNELQKLDTEKVKPIGHITGVDNVLRDDKKGGYNQIEREDILNAVPERKDDYVKVRAVL